MKENRNSIVHRALQVNFKSRPEPKIPEGWRDELKEKISAMENIHPLKEEVLYIKYEKRFWNVAWISFAASLFIFLGLLYILNCDRLTLKETVSRQMYQCLIMEDKL
jgi:hypothetical protein